jgi:hypothetical protein
MALPRTQWNRNCVARILKCYIIRKDADEQNDVQKILGAVMYTFIRSGKLAPVICAGPHIYMCAFVRACVCLCVYVCMYVCVYVCMYVCVCVCICMYVCVCVCVCVCVSSNYLWFLKIIFLH